MTAPDVSVVLRSGLLDGCRIALAGGVGELADAVRALGARPEPLGADELADEEDAARWARERVPLHGLVVDARPGFGNGGAGGLDAALALTWRAARAVATGAMIEQERPGRLVFIGPRPRSGEHAGAARAGLENLARSLSVEWARHGITTTSIAPGPGTSERELALLACYLMSVAGAYLSGCALELGAVASPS